MKALDPSAVGTIRSARIRQAAPSPEPEMEEIPLPARRPPSLDPMPGPGLPGLIAGAQQALAARLKATSGLFSFHRPD